MKYQRDRKKYPSGMVIANFPHCMIIEEIEYESLLSNKRTLNQEVFEWCIEHFGRCYFDNWAFHVKSSKKSNNILVRFREKNDSLAFKLAWAGKM